MANLSMQSMATFWPVFGLVMLSLVLFGIGYNALTMWLERNKLERGFVSLLVVGGVGVTVLAMTPLIGIEHVLILLAGLAAAGLPMMIGSIWRYMDARAADEKAAQELAKEALDVSSTADRKE